MNTIAQYTPLISLTVALFCMFTAGMLSMRLVMMGRVAALESLFLRCSANTQRAIVLIKARDTAIDNLRTEISRLNNVAGKLHTVRDKTGRFKCKT